MVSVDDERSNSPSAAEAIETIFESGDQLAAMLSDLGDQYDRRIALDYLGERRRLLASWRIVGAALGGTPQLAEAVLDEVFPQTLAEVYDSADRVGVMRGRGVAYLSRWNSSKWQRLQEFLLRLLADVKSRTDAPRPPLNPVNERQQGQRKPTKAQLRKAERTARARELDDQGLTRKEIARDLGVKERVVYDYLE